MGVDGFSSQNLASTETLLCPLFPSGYPATVEPLTTCASAAHAGLGNVSVDLQYLNHKSHLLGGLGCGCGDGNSAPTSGSEDRGFVADLDGVHGI